MGKKLRCIMTKDMQIKSFILLFAIIIGAFLELIGVAIIVPFVEAISNANFMEKMKFIWQIDFVRNEKDAIVFLGIAIITVYFFKNLYLFLLNYFIMKYVYSSQMRTSKTILEHHMRRDYTYHTSTNSSVIVRNVMDDVSQIFELVKTILYFISDIVVTVMLGIYLLYTDMTMTLIIVAFLSLFLIFHILFFRNRINKYGKSNLKYRQGMIKWINQSLGGIKEIKVTGREEYFVSQFVKNANGYAKSVTKYNVIAKIPQNIIEVLGVVAIMITLIVKIILGEDMVSFIPKLSAFAMASFKLMPAFSKLNAEISTITYYKPSVNFVYDIVSNIEFDEKCLKNMDAVGKLEQSEFEGIEIKELSYRYPENDVDTLHNVNLNIAKGASVAIIGKSGEGKTTLIDNILGVLKPTAGIIKYDGIDILTDSNWKDKVAYIPQNIYLLDDTIRKNVAFGIEDEAIDDCKVADALKKANLYEFVSNLEDKENTIVGELGARLSGGQRQRIGIARALYNNPEVLIMDEATSALDNNTEGIIMETIEKLQNEKTLIIVAHRLSTIKNCDYVYRIENKNVILEK